MKIQTENLNINNITDKAKVIRSNILKDDTFKNDLDIKLEYIPKPFKGNDVKIFIIGQDPTIQNEKSRIKIKTVLNLNYPNSLNRYVNLILTTLNYDMNNLYATNFYKCFFAEPPAPHKEILTRHFRYWLDLIKEELDYYPNAKILTLGEPLIQQFITNENKRVSFYWNYIGKTTSDGKFSYVSAKDNVLGRDFFPLPHQPSYAKNRFYKKYFAQYLNFVKNSKCS
jgi:uracil-DNA glycosylase